MNAFLTLIPLLLIRYVLLGIINKDSLKRAALFAPLKSNEVTAFWLYQITTAITMLYLFFLDIKITSDFFNIGLLIYILGIIMYTVSVVNFAQPEINGMNFNGLYKISRNPMYLSYFIYFVGVSIMAQSFILLIILIIFQISAHWIILSEERWCIEKFGEDYMKYMDKVRRYI